MDPQIVVGLLVTPTGFPLEIHVFTGNTAETVTLIPVLHSFQHRHGVDDLVVVADAGMLSAGNLNALEDAGFSFNDGETLESVRVMGVGPPARERRVVYHYSSKRARRDTRWPSRSNVPRRPLMAADH